MNDWLNSLIAWLEGTALTQSIRDTSWAVPLIQTIHILSIGIVFSSSLILMLATFGLLGNDWSPARWNLRLHRWSWGGLVVLLVSGTLLVVGEPERSLTNFIFQMKMLMVIIAALLTWVLSQRLQTAHGRSEEAGHATAATRLLALGTLAVWLAIISAGRWIAYYAG